MAKVIILKLVEEINMMKLAKTCSKLLGMLLVGIGSLGFAAGASAVDVGVGANVGVQTQGTAGTPAAGARVDESSDARVSTHQNINQNDQKLPDASRGMERAQERMNAVGAEHEQATTVGAKSKKHVAKKKQAPTE